MPLITVLLVLALLVGVVTLFMLAARAQTRDWTAEDWHHANRYNRQAAAWNEAHR